MRDILTDAHEHRDDGYGRAQAAEKREMPKRFYKKVSVNKADNQFEILLDGKNAKTPSKKPLKVPNEELANIIADEWSAQKTHINAPTMVFTRLVNSALEGKEGIEKELINEIIKYAGNDLLCYRAQNPVELIELQEEQWDKILLVLTQKLGVKFISTAGIIHVEQPKNSLQILADLLHKHERIFLAAMTSITGITGSALLAIAIFQNLVSADEAWRAAHVDEDYNDSIWGQDVEAQKRRDKRQVEFNAAVKLVELMRF